MARTLQDVLGHVYLGGLVRGVQTGIPNVLPPAFFNVTEKTYGDATRYTRVTGTRQTARRTERNAPSRKRTLLPVGEFDVKMPTVKENISLDVDTYQRLRSYTAYEFDRGRMEVERQASEFRALFDNHRVAMVCSALANGKVWYDTDGNLLPTSSGAAVTIDFGVAATHQGSLNSIIAASWATPTTDISLHIRNLKLAAIKETGYRIKYCMYGKNVPTYLAANNYFKDWLIRNPVANQGWLDTGGSEIPQGFQNLTWIPVWESFYEDANGTNQELFGADAIIFFPEIDSTWWEFREGSYPNPTAFGPMGNLPGCVNSFEQVYGMSSYAKPQDDPPTATLVGVDVCLGIIKNPSVIWQGDATP